MNGCILPDRVTGFTKPRQPVKAIPPLAGLDHADQLRMLLDSAVGALLIRAESHELLAEKTTQLEDELVNRLSLEWFQPNAIPYRRIALIEARPDYASYEAVKAMGIGLIVLDKPGSWMQDPNGPYAHLRECFIPFDFNPDTGFKDRLKEVMQRIDVDGIITRVEPLFAMIAEVCEELGLPTAPPEAVQRGIDKHAQRQLANEDSSLRVSSVAELQQALQQDQDLRSRPWFRFPLVVKPCLGDASQCVTKVSTTDELVQAVAKIQTRVLGVEGSRQITSDALIEPYVGGPEIDANLVLWDGKLLFSEISDDFPSTADREDATMQDDFQETMFVYPSKLPRREQDAVTAALHRSVLRMGFTSGIFHVEARVRNSSMHYVRRDDGITELVERATSPEQQPGDVDVFLLEVNARPPGYTGMMAAAYTYGVDYYALHALCAVGDEARFKALSQPFLRGPQYTSALVLIMPERGGVLRSGDPGEELRRTRPDLMAKIPIYREMYAQGEEVPAPDGPWMRYVSCVVVVSREGREDLLQTVEDLRRCWKHEVGDGPA
jgi:biotin carboxylase